MILHYKPDFAETRAAWTHYWNRELYRGRPLVVAQGLREGCAPLAPAADPHDRLYLRAVTHDWDAQLARIDAWLERAEFYCEALPRFAPDFGPDQFAAFCGAPLKYSESSPQTNWVEPIVRDWDAFPVAIDPASPTWTGILEWSRRLAAHAKGRYLVGVCDLHGNADVLSALRGAELLCMDLLDHPALLARKMLEARRLFPQVYNALWDAAGMSRELGSAGWAPFWCEGRFATIQCDFLCMVSPEIGREWILPALAEEARFLDHCVLHLDGPGALAHLDGVLAIREIDVIQWVSGAGQKPMWQWLDVLKRCQAAGKGLQLYDLSIEQAKTLHRELDPVGLVYCVGGSRSEVEDFARWLTRNT